MALDGSGWAKSALEGVNERVNVADAGGWRGCHGDWGLPSRFGRRRRATPAALLSSGRCFGAPAAAAATGPRAARQAHRIWGIWCCLVRFFTLFFLTVKLNVIYWYGEYSLLDLSMKFVEGLKQREFIRLFAQ